MIVIVSQKPLQSGSKTRGVGVYTRELISALRKSFPADKIIPSSSKYYQQGADLVHFPFFDPFFTTLPRKFNAPTIVTIHDLIPLVFPQHFASGIRGKIKLLIQKNAVRRASHIITDSQKSKDDIARILRIREDKITVVPLAHSEEKVPTIMARKIHKKYNLPEKYLLYVGDINWNKNVVGLVEAFAKLKDQEMHLVLVGKAMADQLDISEWRELKKAIDLSGKSDRIHLIGYAPTHHLPVFFRFATLYVQPSWYEGFGLPLLEAMTYGCPVASSDRGSLPEVGGDAVAYFDPAKNMLEVISEVTKNTRLRNALVQKGLERVKLFSWEKTANETHAVYQRVLDQKNHN